MGSVMSELLQVLAVVAVAFVVFSGVALFLKAESATWNQKPEEPAT